MKPLTRWALILPLIATAGCARPSLPADAKGATQIDRTPVMLPDYAGTRIPPNIAPMNFAIEEDGVDHVVAHVIVHSVHGQEEREVRGQGNQIIFDTAWWTATIPVHAGGEMQLDIFALLQDGRWVRYAPVVNTIAAETVDPYLAYRRMPPWYAAFREMGIYQRELCTFQETPILRNNDATANTGQTCINCHSFANNDPQRMTIHTRFPFAMLSEESGVVNAVETRTKFNSGPYAYAAWHPRLNLAAYSVNKIMQLWHTTGETRDVFDFASDLVIYRFDTNVASTAPAMSDPDKLETFPAWSSDGRYLYFCRADVLPDDQVYLRYRDVKYDLVRIAFNPETYEWGELETVRSVADNNGRSAAMPRISPDGRHLVYCLCDYGTFPIFQTNSDIYLLDLETGQQHALECNSPFSESWHSWSTNGRWLAFSSKRQDELFARPYMAYIDSDGRASKAFVLPQEDPEAYERSIETYSVPEFITGPVAGSGDKLAHALHNVEHGVVTPAQLDPEVLPRQTGNASAPTLPYTSPLQ